MKSPGDSAGYQQSQAPATEAVVGEEHDRADDPPLCARCDEDEPAEEADPAALDERLPDEPLCRYHILSIIYDDEH